jgi:putative tributyrin esterase
MAWLHIHYHSEILKMPVAMEVLLPQHITGGINKVEHPGPYKTLYLLHGMGHDQTAWMRYTSIERYVQGLPIAVVMPAGHLSWYTDMAYGRDYFRFITEELPKVCERMFPLSTSREDRFIAGLSMGGYGAMKAGLLASESFSVAASFSGVMDIYEVFDYMNEKNAGDVFGDMGSIKSRDNDLFKAAEGLSKSDEKLPKLYMWCGTEDSLYESNIRFKEHALKLGLTLTYEEEPGDHQWKYWDKCIERLISWLPLNHFTEGEGRQQLWL